MVQWLDCLPESRATGGQFWEGGGGGGEREKKWHYNRLHKCRSRVELRVDIS